MVKKILLIPIPVIKPVEGGTSYYYPSQYDIHKISVLGYGDFDSIKMVDHLLGVVDEKDISIFMGIDGTKELTVEEADILGKKYNPPQVIIKNKEKLVVLSDKIIAGTTLSQDEKDFFDKKNATDGIIEVVFDINKHL